MSAYYNEINLYAAAWLRNLIAGGHIAPGVVDTRSIEDVRPSDLDGFDQCHFFAGIGIWSYALRAAGWPDDRPVWTGSCPCQPFSSAGQGAAFADERHLWPAWHHLIRERRPESIFGEQVANSAALGWYDLVQADLETENYACAAFDLCAASVGADHIRQRLWLFAYPERTGQSRSREPQSRMHSTTNAHEEASGLVDALRGGTLPYVCGRHDGYSNGMEQMRAYGNAINAEQARIFIETVMEAL